MILNRKKESFKEPRPKRIGQVTRKDIMNIAKIKSEERYGKEVRMKMRYCEQVGRMFKSDVAKFSVDVNSQQDLLTACHIFSDINVFTVISLWSNKLTMPIYDKYKANLLKAEQDKVKSQQKYL